MTNLLTTPNLVALCGAVVAVLVGVWMNRKGVTL